MKKNFLLLGLIIAIVGFAVISCDKSLPDPDSLDPDPLIEMVRIPAGFFTMGSPTDEKGHLENESPQRQVTLSAFYMGKYQVTQEEWQFVMTGNENDISVTPSSFHGGDGMEPAGDEVQVKRPVERVSWYDVLVFANRLSVMEGLSPAYRINNSTNPNDLETVPTAFDSPNRAEWDAVEIVSGSTGYRLPTEAQWEYAARAGTTTAFYNVTDDWQDQTALDPIGWFNFNSDERTHEVGKKAANAWGLYDMSGNVWEWCWDWYGDEYPSEAESNPLGVSSGSNRVVRGGGWRSSAQAARSAFRGFVDPWSRVYDLGFRLVRP